MQEPIYARRQQSDYFTTSPDQYNLFGNFGVFSPRYSIKNKYQDHTTVFNVEYVGRLEPNNMPKSPAYTISRRHEPPLDPDGLVGATYMPPPLGNYGPKYSIRRRVREDAPSTPNPVIKPRTSADCTAPSYAPTRTIQLPSLEDMDIPKVDRGEGPWPDFSKVTPRFQVHEPESEPGSARSFGMSTRIVNTHDEFRCGPIGQPEFRKLPDLPSGPRWTIAKRETADFVR
jgi:hypothetical protein